MDLFIFDLSLNVYRNIRKKKQSVEEVAKIVGAAGKCVQLTDLAAI